MERMERIKRLLFDEAKKAGITEFDVYCRFSETQSAEALNKELNSCSSGRNGGVSFRCAVDGKLGMAATQSMEEEALRALVRRAAENAAVLDADEPPLFFGGAPESAYRSVKVDVPTLPGTDVLREKVMDLQEKLYAQSKLMTDGTASAASAADVFVGLANGNGVMLSRRAGSVCTYVEPILKDGDEPSFGFAFAPTLSGEGIVEKATDEALARLGARTAATGKYDVVFSPKEARTLLGAFAGIFNGKNALLGLSLLAGKVGCEVASSRLTVIDDPFYPENPMQCAFDAEGVPTREKAVIEKGVLKTLLFDLTNAKKAGVESTGNASRGYADPVSIAPYCLRIAPGEETREALFGRMGNGIYITELKGLHAGADAVTGDFSIESAGFLVENGVLGAPVHSFTVAGNFFELLRAIDGVGNDVEMGMPSTTVMAAPSLLVRGLSVAGE